MTVVIWAVLVLTVVYLLQRWLFQFVGFHKLTYIRSFSQKETHAGQTIELRETISNRKRLPLPWFRVETMMPAQLVFKHQESHMSINRGEQLQNHASLFSVPAYTEIVRRHEVLCVQRGCYQVSSYTASLGDLVGLSVVSRQDVTDGQLTVFPRVHDIQEFPLSARKYLQSIRSMNSPLMEDHYHVSGVRQYRSGDSFRMINWSATAKTGDLLVHKRESMCNNDLTLLINAELLDPVRHRIISREQFESALSYAASAAQYMVNGGGKVGLIYNGNVDGTNELLFRMKVQGGSAHLLQMLRAMARFESGVRLGLTYALEQLIAERTRGVNYLLITAYVDARLESLIGQLRRAGNTVELLIIARGVA